MWDAKRQLRLEALFPKKEQGGLSEDESLELQSMTELRVQAQEDALEASTRRINQTAEQMRADAREIEAQNKALEELAGSFSFRRGNEFLAW